MKTLKEIEDYATSNFVPIARKDFVEYLKKLIIENQYHEVLEIGSAIGYTAINLALLNDVYVTTIEHNYERYKIALENIQDFKLENKIKIINDDANEVFLSLKYDVIFIDAAKAKNQIFFFFFSNNLNENGIIIIDNMNLIDFQKHVSPKKASFYLNINKNLKRYLNSLTNYSVTYLDVGDGIALIKKK